MSERTFETDVLVIGGGISACYAAVNASRLGVDVTVLTKGLLGKSGCSTMAALLPVSRTTSRPNWLESDAKWWVSGFGHWLADQELIRRVISKGDGIVQDLENLGVCFRRREDGSFEYSPNAGVRNGELLDPVALIASKVGETGRKILDALSGEVRRRRIRVLEETAATSLCTKGGEVVGATALDYGRGEFLVVKAKATIMATGPGGYLWTYQTLSRECAGDGHMMAYRAGAELDSLEMQEWHIADLAKPYSWRRLQMYGFPVPPGPEYKAASYFNIERQPFLTVEEITRDHGATPAKVLASAIKKGLAMKRGGYYANVEGFDPEFNLQADFLKKLGIDPKRDLVECGMSVHTLLGGIRSNIRGETSLPGLYAAGTVRDNFMPSLLFCLATASDAALPTSERARKMRTPDVAQQQVEAERSRVFSFLKPKPDDGYIPAQVKRRIRDIMYENMHFSKSEGAMRSCLNLLKDVRDTLVPRMGLTSETRRFNYAWVEALEVQNMLLFAELIVQSSLLRSESRGPFLREDYPHTDNRNWLKRIVVKQEEGRPRFFTVPVELPYFRPEVF